MNVFVICFLDLILQDGGEATIPDAGIRISVWFIGMFFLAVGAALLYMRMKEADAEGQAGTPRKDDE